jgi:TonB family protein
MYYYEVEDKSSRRTGIAAGIIYILVWVVMFLVITINIRERDLGQGILINFGDTEDAFGLNDPGVNTVAPRPRPVTRPSQQTTAQPIMTQDTEDAPEVAVAVEQRPSPNPSTTTQPQDSRPAETAPQQEEQPRVADPRLNFPGRTEGSTSTSEGTTQGEGNQGALEGTPEGSHEGAGEGGGGIGFDLAGRSVVGSLPAPNYPNNKQGRVIVEITVDPGGVVVNAIYRARGSTTNDSQLINAAINAARRSRFSLIDAEGLQTGTITYNFRLK